MAAPPGGHAPGHRVGDHPGIPSDDQIAEEARHRSQSTLHRRHRQTGPAVTDPHHVAYTGPRPLLVGDEGQHVLRRHLGGLLVDEPEEDLQVVGIGPHRARSAPGRGELQELIDQLVADPIGLLAVRTDRTLEYRTPLHTAPPGWTSTRGRFSCGQSRGRITRVSAGRGCFSEQSWLSGQAGTIPRWSARTGLPEGARNVTLASAEYRTNVTLICFRSFQRHLQVHSNVTLAARNLTLTPEWAEFSSGEGKVLKSGRWPGPPFGPRVSPCSSAAHNRPNTIARAPVPCGPKPTRRRSALAFRTRSQPNDRACHIGFPHEAAPPSAPPDRDIQCPHILHSRVRRPSAGSAAVRSRVSRDTRVMFVPDGAGVWTCSVPLWRSRCADSPERPWRDRCPPGRLSRSAKRCAPGTVMSDHTEGRAPPYGAPPNRTDV